MCRLFLVHGIGKNFELAAKLKSLRFERFVDSNGNLRMFEPDKRVQEATWARGNWRFFKNAN